MPMYGERNGQWADALDPIVRFRFDQAFSRRASLIDRLFNVQTSVRAYEQVSGVGAIGVEAWNQWSQSGVVGQADFDQGYKTTYAHIEYPLEIQIRRSLIDDANFNEVFRIVDRVGDSARVKREIDAASVFNNAFSASYLGGDGVALCSNSHPFSPQKTGATQDNNGTLALTKTNVATTREAMMAFTDDAGNKMGVTPDLLIVPPELEDEALVITQSMLDPDTGTNAKNPQNNRFGVQAWHYLTDTNAWFMVDSILMKQMLDWWDRVLVGVSPKVEDKTLLATWIGYMRYSYGFSGWQWIYGNNPS